jgi:ABC-type Fe3+ transport system permease subunit
MNGMGWLGGLGRIAGLGLLAALLLPILAPWASAVLDLGPDGPARLSGFPLALAAFDPFVLEAARNSTILAGLVAGGSLVLGVGLGHLAGPGRFRGRASLRALAILPMAAGPLLIAPGILLLIGGPRRWDWLAARSLVGCSCEDLARWAALGWAGVAWGTPLVALATEAALRRVDPAWSEAARAVGASPWRAWRDVTWPVLRPEAARAAASVFTLALVEPAAPLVLGLRRTLAVQMLGAANRLDQPTRAAILALFSILIAVLARTAILRWVGPSALPAARARPDPLTIPAGRRRTLASLAILAGWSVVAAGPVAALLWRATDPERGAGLGRWSNLLLGGLADPEARRWTVNAGSAGLLAVVVDILVLRSIFGRGPLRLNRATRLILVAFEAVPPLAWAVGALCLAWLLGVGADRAGVPGGWLRAIAQELSPARSPGILLILAIAAARLPTMARAAIMAGDRSLPILIDAALTMGQSPRRAGRAGGGRWRGSVRPGPLALSMALAWTSLTPALLLAAGSERRTLAPAVLGWVLEPGPIDPRAAGPIAALLGINLVGLALASGGRSGPPGDWFRG